MRIAVFLVCCVVCGRVASAAPAVIAVPRVEVYQAPSETAEAISELGRGVVVCTLDESGEAGAAQAVPGWLAVRSPGEARVGYVRREAVELGGVSDASAQACDPAAQATTSRPGSSRPPSVQALLSAVAGRDDHLPAAGLLVPQHPVRIAFGMGSGAAWLKKAEAARHRIDDFGLTFNMGAALTIYDVFSVSGSVSLAYPSDDAPFMQDVVPEVGGDDEVPTLAESSVAAYSLSIAAGLRTPFLALGARGRGGPWLAAFVDYGTADIRGGRSIKNCTNCREDDFDMPSGRFWRAGFDLAPAFRFPKLGWSFTTAYQRYDAAAGFAQEIRLGLTLWLL